MIQKLSVLAFVLTVAAGMFAFGTVLFELVDMILERLARWWHHHAPEHLDEHLHEHLHEHFDDDDDDDGW